MLNEISHRKKMITFVLFVEINAKSIKAVCISCHLVFIY